MKRVGNLMERIVHPENLREAFLRAARGKSEKKEVVRFRENLDAELDSIAQRLISGEYRFDSYRFFTIYDPKKRRICAAPFADRVTFHAMMRICHPVFDNYQIFDSYASRKGKGQYQALERARQFAGKYRWFAKLDVCSFFDSIDHGVMLSQLASLFKDKLLLSHFQTLLDSYHTVKGKGLPIGNLTSQYFANHYMAVADHYAKEQLGVKGLVRYMDDVIFFGNDKQQLLGQVSRYTTFVSQELRMDMHPMILNRTECGIPFLGYVVYKYKLRLNIRSCRRYKKKVLELSTKLLNDEIKETEFLTRMTALTSFVCKADSNSFRKKVYNQKQVSSTEQALTV